MKVMITGGDGFIGGNIYWTLKTMGIPTFSIDKKRDYDLRKIYKTDCDIVIHCAANLYDNFEENIGLTKKVSEFSQNAKVIFMSSAAVYGSNHNAKETDRLQPYGDYGYAKFIEECIIRDLVDDSVIFRLGNVYGQTSDHGVFHKIMNGLRDLNNNGESVRDFVNVEDVVDAVIRVIMQDITGTFNIATGKGTTIQELYYKLNPLGPDHTDAGFKKEISESVLNIDLARKWGYEPEVVL